MDADGILLGVMLVAFVACFITLPLALYHFYNTLNGIKGRRQVLVGVLAPFSILMPSNFDKKGNYHRIRMGRYVLASIVLLVLVFGLDAYLEEQRHKLTNRPTPSSQNVDLDRP